MFSLVQTTNSSAIHSTVGGSINLVVPKLFLNPTTQCRNE